MPYIRHGDFARLRELVKTIEQLAQRGKNGAIADIAIRALKVLEKYIVEREEE